MHTPSVSRSAIRVSMLTVLAVLSACSKPEPAPPAAQTTEAAPARAEESPLVASINGEWRSGEDKARDQYRHPKESLEFWGLAPNLTVLEIWPGGGWWSDILAPYAHKTGGRYYATAADLANPQLSEGARKARAEFEARFAAKPEVYGQVNFVNFGMKSAPLPENTFDLILLARSFHNMMEDGVTGRFLKDFYGALKP